MTRTHHSPSPGPSISRKPPKSRESAREKVDKVVRFLRTECGWSVDDFVTHYCTEDSNVSGTPRPATRRKKLLGTFRRIWNDPVILLLDGGVIVKDMIGLVGKSCRDELHSLIQQSRYFGKWTPDATQNLDFQEAQREIRSIAPSLSSLLLELSANQRHNWEDACAMPATDHKLLLLAAVLGYGHARNNATWFATTIGLNLHMQGTPRRGIELWSSLGVIVCYKEIRSAQTKIAESQLEKYKWEVVNTFERPPL